MAYLSYKLATIKTDVELDVTPASIKNTLPDNTLLKTLFTDLEFKSWISELDNPNTGSNTPQVTWVDEAAPNTINYETILDQQRLSIWLEKLSKADLFAFDTETTSLNIIFTLCT